MAESVPSPAAESETPEQVQKFESLPSSDTPKQRIKLKKDAISKAVRAMKQMYARDLAESPEKLLANDTKDVFIDVIFAFDISNKRKAPLTFPLPHPIWDPETDICVFTKSPKSKYKTWLLDEQQVPRVKKIIDFEKVRTRYVHRNDKQNLSRAYDVFVAEATIYDRVVKHLGPEFRAHNKNIPYPMVLERFMYKNADPKDRFEQILRTGQFKRVMGRNSSVKVGDFNMTEAQLCENVVATVKGLLRCSPENLIMNLFIKYQGGNLTLPIYRRPNTPGDLLDLPAWKLRSESSAASDTGASGISDTEITAGTSDAGETLSTRDTTSENETGDDEISASILETESSLVESEGGDVESSSAPPTPTKSSKKKKMPAQEKSSAMPPPKKAAKKK